MTKPRLPWVKMALMLPLTLINIAGGLFFIWMPFLFVIGIALLIIAAMPYAMWMHKYIEADVAYANRDHTLTEDEEKPWEQASSLSDEDIMNIMLNGNGRGRSE